MWNLLGIAAEAKDETILRIVVRRMTSDLEAVEDEGALVDREAHSASRLDHPNCVRVTDFGTTENGTKYLVMELLEGGDLDGRLGQPWPPARAVATIEQVLHGLEHAHHVGIVHRDLKPENIYLVEWLGHSDFVKLLDFGIAKLTEVEGGDRKLTRTGMLFGTPELKRGEPLDWEAVQS